jgi:hypothetical protein
VASVVDLSLVPSLYWLMASVMIGQAHEKSAREVAREELPGADPAEYVLILQDWGGLISRGSAYVVSTARLSWWSSTRTPILSASTKEMSLWKRCCGCWR